ncbi:hypothetical protein [Legionella shakespearei]|uniref:Uncharacterized protein n=1 Tax=Legionella shakespearei DSM 23087 TaxID=1122169 RepID=A0A0W0Z7T0_9GAMM|nr:hypothetical protein [Legionella shakespearei]KTD65163.1 hypothetical protein Lsha_0532 [Legionella shakespearei DSM 23087]
MFLKREYNSEAVQRINNHINGLNTVLKEISADLNDLEKYMSNRNRYDRIALAITRVEVIETEEDLQDKDLVLRLTTRFSNSIFYTAPELIEEYGLNPLRAALRAHQERVSILNKIKTGEEITHEELELLKKVPVMSGIEQEVDIKIATPSAQPSM